MNKMNFEDHFSQRAGTYARFRPRYPAALFAYLAAQSPGHQLAWDCATGSGQAALSLVERFEQVIATDASAEQINQAVQHERIIYRVEPAEITSLNPNSVDLVTVAVAIHWFDLDRFYLEVRRVLNPGGILAAWTYHRPKVNPRFDEVIAGLECEILAGYWPERIHYLQEHYQTIPFPFNELSPPAFAIEAEWHLDQMIGFISSWSAVRRYEEETGIHPLKAIWGDFLSAWGDVDAIHAVQWPLYMRVGLMPGRSE